MTITIFAESLKRLYSDGKIAIFKLKELKEEGKITNKEYEYIIANKKVGD